MKVIKNYHSANTANIILAIIGIIAIFVIIFGAISRFIDTSPVVFTERYKNGDLYESEWKAEMIKRGLAHYNSTNGNWEWKTNDIPVQIIK